MLFRGYSVVSIECGRVSALHFEVIMELLSEKSTVNSRMKTLLKFDGPTRQKPLIIDNSALQLIVTIIKSGIYLDLKKKLQKDLRTGSMQTLRLLFKLC